MVSQGDGFGVGFRGVVGGGFHVENERKGEGGGEGPYPLVSPGTLIVF